MYILHKDFLDFSFGMAEKGTKKRPCPAFYTDKALVYQYIGAQSAKRRVSPDKEAAPPLPINQTRISTHRCVPSHIQEQCARFSLVGFRQP